MVQAITEFLPVSSSGHLALFQSFQEDLFPSSSVQLAFNVLVHFATFLVTVAYYFSDILNIIRKFFFGNTRERKGARKLVACLLIGSIPAAVIGLVFKQHIEASFSALLVVGSGFLLTSLLLEMAGRLSKSGQRSISSNVECVTEVPPSVFQAFLVGFAQAISILPGVSRSGSTICTGLLLGLRADIAVRFSFLLSLPVILGAALLEARKLDSLPSDQFLGFLLGFMATITVGWFAMDILVKAVRKLQLRPFAIYTGVLGVAVLGSQLL
jgi:undecaprenyl-diphosphatase